jgi:hypothetical protein
MDSLFWLRNVMLLCGLNLRDELRGRISGFCTHSTQLTIATTPSRSNENRSSNLITSLFSPHPTASTIFCILFQNVEQ